MGISVVILVAFATLLLLFLVVLTKGKKKEYAAIRDITVVIPFKNEMKYLPDQLKMYQKFLAENPFLNFILVNDHSIDLTKEFRLQIAVIDRLSMVDLPKNMYGKKAAISLAVERATTKWLLIADADTRIPQEILKPESRILPHEALCVLVPIRPKKTGRWINALFDLEFLSLQVAGLASANIHLPLLANGACMLICRKAYLQTKALRTDWNMASGDDVFTMFAISKYYGRNKISVLPQKNAMAEAAFPERFAELFSQRVRWVSKSGGVKDFWFRMVSFLVVASQIVLVIFGLKWFLSDSLFVGNLLIAVLSIEILYLGIAAFRFKRMDLLPSIVPAILIYPFYLMVLLIFSTFAKPKWK